MMSKILKIFVVALFLLFPIYLVFSAEPLSVVINEIAWMGSEVDWRDEWIELRNMTDQDIDLSGWIIENASKNHGSLEIPQDGKHTILSNSYYLISYYSKADNLLEPKTALDVIVDWRVKNMGIISFANNYKDNGQLRLKDDSGALIDQTPSSADENWPAGDNSTKQTMERGSSGNWQNSQEPNGTPKAENSVSVATEPSPPPLEEPPTQSEPQPEPQTEPEPQPESESLPEPEPESEPKKKITPITYPAGVVFNEILPSPEGPDAENEWIEIYNQNDFGVDLSSWTIQDTAGSTKTYTLNKKIPALGYLIFLRPETKITLNNDGDGLSLINPKGEIIDSVIFGKASLNKSYSKTQSGWVWNNNLTPGAKNIIPQSSKPSPAKTLTGETKKLEDKAREVSASLTNINLRSLDSENKSLVFLIAFIVALLCSIVFLIIKSNLKAFWY